METKTPSHKQNHRRKENSQRNHIKKETLQRENKSLGKLLEEEEKRK